MKFFIIFVFATIVSSHPAGSVDKAATVERDKPQTTTEVGASPKKPLQISGSQVLKSSGNSKATTFGDDALTPAQIDQIEERVKLCIEQPVATRKDCLRGTYDFRKDLIAENQSKAAEGQAPTGLMSKEDYVSRYNIPGIRVGARSNIDKCLFDTAKDNWMDYSNIHRNAELFLRAFEASSSGALTPDYWYLRSPTATSDLHTKSLNQRVQEIMTLIRANRMKQSEQLKHLDLLMMCQCMYTQGPDKFPKEQQSAFYAFCTGQSENKICRAEDIVAPNTSMKDTLRVPGSEIPAFEQGEEFPDYVSLHLSRLEKSAQQNSASLGGSSVENLDSSAAGINHEEVLVRWLRLRSCNQLDIFLDVEKVETSVDTLSKDVQRAGKEDDPTLLRYWNDRLGEMRANGVDENIIKFYENDTEKTKYFRGYVATESKFHEYEVREPRWFHPISAIRRIAKTMGIGGKVALVAPNYVWNKLGLTGNGVTVPGGSTQTNLVVWGFIKDFPNVMVEDRMIHKRSCGRLRMYNCKKYVRILHWPAFSNSLGLERLLPFSKIPANSCLENLRLVRNHSSQAQKCSGLFKGTMCSQNFLRPIDDPSIKNDPQYQTKWAPFMKETMMMDPLFPDLMGEVMRTKINWLQALHTGMEKGCQWLSTIGRKEIQFEDKFQFVPDLTPWFQNGKIVNEFAMTEARIEDYKAAVQKYAFCDDLQKCGAKHFDATTGVAKGFSDIFTYQDEKGNFVEDKPQAQIFSNYVYQHHFLARTLSEKPGLGYPLRFQETYFNALLYNFKILSSLAVRRGMEMDDGVRLYGDDLAVRRGQYQLGASNRGVKPGQDSRLRMTNSPVFKMFESLGFPMSVNFVSAPQGASALGTTGNGTLRSAGNTSSNFASTLSAAAMRHSARIAQDNQRYKKIQQELSQDPQAGIRLSETKKSTQGLLGPLGVQGSAQGQGANPTQPLNGNQAMGGSRPQLTTTEDDQTLEVSDQDRVESDSLKRLSGDTTDGAFPLNSKNSSLQLDASSLQSFYQPDGSLNVDQQLLQQAAQATGLAQKDLTALLEETHKMEKRQTLSALDQDSLFRRVSKAYLRSLERVLLKKKNPGTTSPQQHQNQDKALSQEQMEIKSLFKPK
jgi:hypothetical protein